MSHSLILRVKMWIYLSEPPFNPLKASEMILVQVMWPKVGMKFRFQKNEGDGRGWAVGCVSVAQSFSGASVFVMTRMPPRGGEERVMRILCLCSPCHIEKAWRRPLPSCHEGDNLRGESWAEGTDISLISGVFKGLCHMSLWKNGLAPYPHQAPLTN